MEEPTNPGGGSWRGESSCGGGVASTNMKSAVQDLDKLRPSRPSSAAYLLAKVWVDNPATSGCFTYGFGGLE
jgi:hypothetical protein